MHGLPATRLLLSEERSPDNNEAKVTIRYPRASTGHLLITVSVATQLTCVDYSIRRIYSSLKRTCLFPGF